MIKNIKMNKLEKREAFILPIGIKSVNKLHLFGFATIVVAATEPRINRKQ